MMPREDHALLEPPLRPPKGKRRVRIVTHQTDHARTWLDTLAVEEPLTIRLETPTHPPATLATTMRTPGADFELAAGFLYAEGIIRGRDELARIGYCARTPAEARHNVVTVTLRRASLPELGALERHGVMSSACGVCGRASVDGLEARCAVLPDGFWVRPRLITTLPDKLRAAQGIFDATGGLHAAALFDREGALLALREDVGRHNALDKLVGWALLEGRLPLGEGLVMLSGRLSFELVQKAIAAGVPILAAVSAPSSLAVATARRYNLTLAGFVRGARFNVYAGEARIRRTPQGKRCKESDE